MPIPTEDLIENLKENLLQAVKRPIERGYAYNLRDCVSELADLKGVREALEALHNSGRMSELSEEIVDWLGWAQDEGILREVSSSLSLAFLYGEDLLRYFQSQLVDKYSDVRDDTFSRRVFLDSMYCGPDSTERIMDTYLEFVDRVKNEDTKRAIGIALSSFLEGHVMLFYRGALEVVNLRDAFNRSANEEVQKGHTRILSGLGYINDTIANPSTDELVDKLKTYFSKEPLSFLELSLGRKLGSLDKIFERIKDESTKGVLYDIVRIVSFGGGVTALGEVIVTYDEFSKKAKSKRHRKDVASMILMGAESGSLGSALGYFQKEYDVDFISI